MPALKQLPQPQTEENVEPVRGGPSTEIDRLMRKVFDRPQPESMQQEGVGQPRRDFQAAFDVIERAAVTFDVLVNRCQNLETQLVESAERAKAETLAQEAEIQQWKKLASGMKVHAQETEKRLDAMKARAEAGEARAAMAEARATAAEARCSQLQESSETASRQANALENLSTEFHDKVITAFGIGSRAHMAFEAVAMKAAREQQSAPAA